MRISYVCTDERQADDLDARIRFEWLDAGVQGYVEGRIKETKNETGRAIDESKGHQRITTRPQHPPLSGPAATRWGTRGFAFFPASPRPVDGRSCRELPAGSAAHIPTDASAHQATRVNDQRIQHPKSNWPSSRQGAARDRSRPIGSEK